MREGFEHPVADLQLAGLAPTTGGADQVVRGARQLGPAVLRRLGHGDLQELVSSAVVEPVHDPLGHDGARFGIVGEHLDGEALVDDPADLLRAAIRQDHLGAVMEAAVHDADLLPQLVDEDGDGAGLRQRPRQLAQGLGHEAGLEADVGVAHLALDLGPGGERRHRVDDQHVERTGADEHVGDLERLLAGVGLRDEEVVDVDPDGPRVDRVHGVLGVDVGADAAVALRLGHDVHGQRRLARRLRTVDLHDATPRQAADAERQIEESAPVGTDSMFIARLSPMRMTEPLPNCFSIWPSAASNALSRSVSAICLSPLPLLSDLRSARSDFLLYDLSPAFGRRHCVTLRRRCDGPRRRSVLAA